MIKESSSERETEKEYEDKLKRKSFDIIQRVCGLRNTIVI